MQNDSNGDGKLSPGEDVSVYVYARNTGSSTVDGLWASVATTSEYVKISSCTAHGYQESHSCDGGVTDSSCSCSEAGVLQWIDPGQPAGDATISIYLHLDPTAPLTPIPFSITFHDKSGNTWNDSFSVPVDKTGAQVEVAEIELQNDSNGDGKLSPGEDVSVYVYARNTGSSTVQSLWASVATTSEYVKISSCTAHGYQASHSCDGGVTDSSCSCSEAGVLQWIDPGQPAGDATISIYLHLDPTAPLTPIPFSITFHDKSGNTWNDSFSVGVTP